MAKLREILANVQKIVQGGNYVAPNSNILGPKSTQAINRQVPQVTRTVQNLPQPQQQMIQRQATPTYKPSGLSQFVASTPGRTTVGALAGLSRANPLRAVADPFAKAADLSVKPLENDLAFNVGQIAGAAIPTMALYGNAYKTVSNLLPGITKGLTTLSKTGIGGNILSKAIGAYAVGDPLIGALRGTSEAIGAGKKGLGIAGGAIQGVGSELLYPVQAVANIPKLGSIVFSNKYTPEDRAKAGLGLGLSMFGLLPLVGGLSMGKLLKVVPDNFKPYIPELKAIDDSAKLALGEKGYLRLSRLGETNPQAYVRGLFDTPGVMTKIMEQAETGKIDANRLKGLLNIADGFYDKVEGKTLDPGQLNIGAQGNRFSNEIGRLDTISGVSSSGLGKLSQGQTLSNPTLKADQIVVQPRTNSYNQNIQPVVKSQIAPPKEVVLYHGTSKEIKGELKYPLYLSDNKAYATNYTNPVYSAMPKSNKDWYKLKNKPQVLEMNLNPKADIFDTRNPEHFALLKDYQSNYTGDGKALISSNKLPESIEGTDLQQFLEDKGYKFDGIWLDELGANGERGLSFVAFNKNAIIPQSKVNPPVLSEPVKPMVINRTQLSGKALSTTNSKLSDVPGSKVSQPQTLSPEPQKVLSQPELKPNTQATSGQMSMQLSKGTVKANTAKLKVSSSTTNIPPAAIKEIESVQRSLGSKVSLVDYMRTPDRVLQKIGLADEAQLIKKQYNSYLDQLPEEIGKVTSWYERVGKSDQAGQRIFKYLDGQDIKLEGEELKVATEMKNYLADWADKLKLPKDGRIASYITHIFEKDFVKKEFDEDLAKIIADKVPGSVYDPFLQQRLGKMGYIEDAFRALDAYVKRATRKYNMDPALEQLKATSEGLDLDSMKYVKSYADRINLRPTHLDTLMDTAIKQSPVGYKLGARPVASVTRSLRQAVYRGTLGLNVGSAIRNLTQGANTYAQLGEKYTAIGYMKVFRALVNGSDELNTTGVLRSSFIEDRTLSATKKFWEKVDGGLFSFFQLAEKINRGAAYFGAKSRAIAKGLSEADAIKAGVDMSRKTQFTFGSVDTPVALQSDIAKLFTQFQSFNVKQTEFLADMAKNKEYSGLIRWLGANAVLLFSVGQVMGWDWNDFVPFGGVLDGQSPIGGSPIFTLAKDVTTMATGGKGDYGQPVEIDQILNDLVPIIPGGVQIKKTISGLGDVSKGYSESQAGRVRYPVAQSTGNYIRGGVLGPYKLPEAQAYKKSEATVLGENQSATFKALPTDQRQAYYDTLMRQREVEGIKQDLKDGKITMEQAQQKYAQITSNMPVSMPQAIAGGTTSTPKTIKLPTTRKTTKKGRKISVKKFTPPKIKMAKLPITKTTKRKSKTVKLPKLAKLRAIKYTMPRMA